MLLGDGRKLEVFNSRWSKRGCWLNLFSVTVLRRGVRVGVIDIPSEYNRVMLDIGTAVNRQNNLAKSYAILFYQTISNLAKLNFPQLIQCELTYSHTA